MKTLPSAQEERTTKAAEVMVDLVNEGLEPNDALYKVAVDFSLRPDFVNRVSEVFNVSRTLHHLKTASAESRADAFPLSNASAVLSRLYPAKPEEPEIKTAAIESSVWFAPPPNFNDAPAVKAAQEPFKVNVPKSYNPDINHLIKRARKHTDALKRNFEVVREDENYYKEMLRQSVVKAASYFQSVSHIPFEEVETNVLSQYGSIAKPLMNAVYASCRGDRFGEKRGSVPNRKLAFDSSEEPYKAIDEAIQFAHETVKSSAERQTAQKEYEEFEAKLQNRMNKLAGLKREKIPFPFADVEKSSGILPSIASAMFIGAKATEKQKASKELERETFNEEVQKALDPSHDTQMRAIRTQALLNDLISNDPVISAYPREHVLEAFNELAATTPRLAEELSTLRGTLAQRLEMGRSSPFEADQAIKTETGLKKIHEPPSGFKHG